MELTWLEGRPRDADGATPYVIYYLVDQVSKRCCATIAEPRDGNLLYVTDIRVAGADRSYIDLDAAKSYCEGVAIEDDMRCAAKLRALTADPKAVDDASGTQAEAATAPPGQRACATEAKWE
jgi:hypothetical protein